MVKQNNVKDAVSVQAGLFLDRYATWEKLLNKRHNTKEIGNIIHWVFWSFQMNVWATVRWDVAIKWCL